MKQFEDAGAKLVGLSVDSMFSLKTWAMSMGGIRHPLLADFWPHGGVAKSLGILDEERGFAKRALFIIDPEGTVRHGELHPSSLPQVDATLAKLAELQSG